MSDSRPLVTYEPNPILDFLYKRFFEHIEVDEAWAKAVRTADARGTVVYVLRNLSFVDFFALDHLTKRLNLPQVRFANDLGLWVLEPMGRGWWHALGNRNEASDADDLRQALLTGNSAALFLKRPPTLLEHGSRGKSEGDIFIRTLFDVQRQTDKPILLVPQVFVWSKEKDDVGRNVVDMAFGSREWPGKIRTVAQFLGNYRHVTLRAGDPIDLKTFLAQEKAQPEQAPDDVLVRRITYSLLRRIERERHAVLGPTRKPADRIRDEVLRSPKLQKVISEMAGQGTSERRVMTWRALAMLREMEAQLDMTTIRALDEFFDHTLPLMFSALEVDEKGVERLRQAMKDGSVVLLPSHKSHIDYIVLAYLLYTHHIGLPVIAAGDNLAFFPLGPILRHAGAFFILRSFKGDRLYGAVVDAYMRRLIIDGWSLEFFLEGGRSRTGKLLPPKVGLLSLVVDAALGVHDKPISFMPVSIGYERLVEERSYVRELSGGEKSKEDVRGLFAAAQVLGDRYGRMNVQFGELVTLKDIAASFDENGPTSKPSNGTITPARRRAIVTRLAYRVMNEINRVTLVTAGAVVAMALLTHEQRGVSHLDLLRICRELGEILHAFGARMSPSLVLANGELRESAIVDAVDLFVRAGHVQARDTSEIASKNRQKRPAGPISHGPDVVYVVPDDARLSLDLGKNIVVHFFVARAMVAIALTDASNAEEEMLSGRVQALSRLFKYEFQFRADAPFSQIFKDTLETMKADGEIERDENGVRIGAARHGDRVRLYARVVKNFLEGYRVAARSLAALLRGPLTPKDLAKRAIATGERMFLAAEITRREAISRPLFDSAFSSFVDQGYLTRREGKLVLAASYNTAETLRTIEARIVELASSLKEGA
ncbi:MAG: 1-acyl-sn-glycerol-3-phosphate acyltransferase [Polyangiaceae bacterium]